MNNKFNSDDNIHTGKTQFEKKTNNQWGNNLNPNPKPNNGMNHQFLGHQPPQNNPQHFTQSNLSFNFSEDSETKTASWGQGNSHGNQQNQNMTNSNWDYGKQDNWNFRNFSHRKIKNSN